MVKNLKIMDTVTTRIPLSAIRAETNRRHGGEGNTAVLARSLEKHGLINPIAVMEEADGSYRVAAGRGRFAAALSLGWKTIEAVILPPGTDGEAIALAENVNRADMNPLDEAEHFKKLLDEGKSAGEIALYYARSVTAIYQRARLANLIDGVKTMFKEGKIALSAAALIAGLPPEDQEGFYKKHGKKGADKWEAAAFIKTAQRLVLDGVADAACAACKKRTHNTVPGLFEEEGYTSLKDVCFDTECFAAKWTALIAGLIAGNPGKNVENNIFLGESVPPFLPPRTQTVTIAASPYRVLDPRRYVLSKACAKKKKDTAWFIDVNGGEVTAAKVEYRECEESARAAPAPSAASRPVSPEQVKEYLKEYLVDQIPGLTEEGQKELAAAVAKKHRNSWSLRLKLEENILSAVIEKRLKEESRASLAAAYILDRYSYDDGEGAAGLRPEYTALFSAVFACEGIAGPEDIPLEPLLEKVFLFMAAAEARGSSNIYLPSPNDSEKEWAETEKTLFWKFAQMSREEYAALYQGVLEKTLYACADGKKDAGGAA